MKPPQDISRNSAESVQVARKQPVRTVWVLSDGRPGHFNQSHGLVAALEKLFPVSVEWVDVRLRANILRRPLRTLINATDRAIPLPLLRFFYQICEFPQAVPEVIVSAGGNTSPLNVLLARTYRCQNIFTGSLRGLAARHFSAVLALEQASVGRGGAEEPLPIVVPIGPTAITRDRVRQAAAVHRAETGLTSEKLWTMIVGGDAGGYCYTKGDWVRLAEAMEDCSRRYGCRWLLTTSPRTGAFAEQQLRAALPAEILADAVWYADRPRPVIEPFLGAAEFVFCTEDSMSMLTEAIAAGRPLFALRPEIADSGQRYRQAIERHAAAKRLCRLTIAEFASGDIPSQARQIVPMAQPIPDFLAEQFRPLFAA